MEPPPGALIPTATVRPTHHGSGSTGARTADGVCFSRWRRRRRFRWPTFWQSRRAPGTRRGSEHAKRVGNAHGTACECARRRLCPPSDRSGASECGRGTGRERSEGFTVSSKPTQFWPFGFFIPLSRLPTAQSLGSEPPPHFATHKRPSVSAFPPRHDVLASRRARAGVYGPFRERHATHSCLRFGKVRPSTIVAVPSRFFVVARRGDAVREGGAKGFPCRQRRDVFASFRDAKRRRIRSTRNPTPVHLHPNPNHPQPRVADVSSRKARASGWAAR